MTNAKAVRLKDVGKVLLPISWMTAVPQNRAVPR
jgi:hypothetical protein